MSAEPFVKWLGGKRQLLNQITPYLPHSYNRYYEPFIGSGALFFWINKPNSYISDINPELIYAYSSIANDLENLIKLLRNHKENDTEEYYLNIRNIDLNDNFQNLSPLERAARFLYLNKTCFNGLWRINSKGHNNAAYAHNKNPNICDVDNLIKCREILKNTQIELKNYDNILNLVTENDFVYLDPPYVPLSTTSSFTRYTSSNFLSEDQIKIKNLLGELTKRKVKFLISNSDCDYTRELYKDYNQVFIMANRKINVDGTKRGKISELLAFNYDPPSII